MANDYFQFKRFRIEQAKAAMKITTDSVLLGAWSRIEGCKRILDIGTGSGVVALMLSQRGAGQIEKIDAVEADQESAEQAEENFRNNPLGDKIVIHKMRVQDFSTALLSTPALPSTPNRGQNLYDLILSNPPFFENSQLSPDSSKSRARHTTDLSYHELVTIASALLKPNGVLSLIIPHDKTDKLMSLAQSQMLYPVRICEVSPLASSAPIRTLIEFSPTKPATIISRESLAIRIDDGRGAHTGEFKKLMQDYYLDLE